MRLFLFFLGCWGSLWAKEPASWSLEEKIGQLLMVSFDGETPHPHAEQLIQEGKIGGIILYNWANGLHHPEQIQTLCAQLQQLSLQTTGIPLLIGVDQEGGVVTRLQEGFSQFPGNGALGRSQDPSFAYQACRIMGEEMRRVGIHLNFSPVVDLNQHKQSFIGVRSFGSDPILVTQMAKASLAGYRDAGVFACLKHFPGHGKTGVDSHVDLPTLSVSFEELWKEDLMPYKELASLTPLVMSGHLWVPQVDPEHCVSFSSVFLQKILREKLQFQGVLVSDSLTMRGILRPSRTLKDVALEALMAGHDLLLIGGVDLQSGTHEKSYEEEVLAVIQTIAQAVRDGKVEEKRIDDSLARILQLKEQISHTPPQGYAPETDPKVLAEAIAHRAFQVREGSWDESFVEGAVALILPEPLRASFFRSSLPTLFAKSPLYFFPPNAPAQAEIEKALTKVQKALFLSYNAWKYPAQQAALAQVTARVPTIWVATRDAEDLDFSFPALARIAMWSPTQAGLDVLTQWLKKEPRWLVLSEMEREKIADKIAHNECGRREDLLTFWSPKEPFPSLGIGHFIWPPEGYRGTFQSGRFHDWILFAQSQGETLPDGIADWRYCPWPNRDQFYRAFRSEKMEQLRSFLARTKGLQVEYMIRRLHRATAAFIFNTPPEGRELLQRRLFSLASSSQGSYLLVDYLNFKHEGLDPRERYEGLGWGLFQVLEAMDPQKMSGATPEAFVEAAWELLNQRVQRAPNRAVEETFLKGWKNRLDTYLERGTNTQERKSALPQALRKASKG